MSANDAPNTNLPACPRCSSRAWGRIVPEWLFARHTSEARGRRVYSFSGCPHAQRVTPLGAIHDGAEARTAVEDAWRRLAAKEFQDLTRNWNPSERAAWADFLGEGFSAGPSGKPNQ